MVIFKEVAHDPEPQWGGDEEHQQLADLDGKSVRRRMSELIIRETDETAKDEMWQTLKWRNGVITNMWSAWRSPDDNLLPGPCQESESSSA